MPSGHLLYSLLRRFWITSGVKRSIRIKEVIMFNIDFSITKNYIPV